MPGRSTRRRRITFALALLFAIAVTTVASGQTDRSAYLIQLMGTSSSFRVRAQAALSLGGMGPSSAATQALVTALRDDDTTVRAAAAQSLGRVGDSTALSGLHGIEHDSESAVAQAATAAIAAITARGSGGAPPPSTGTGTTAPAGPARFYIGVGDPGSTVAGIDAALLASARTTAVGSITSMSGVVVAPAGESASAARAAIAARHLRGYFLDISITALETRPNGAIHAVISIVVEEYPSHNIVGTIPANATASGVSGVSGQRAVIQAAIQSGIQQRLQQVMGP